MKAAIFLSTFNKKYYTLAALFSALNQDVDFDYRVYVRENSTDPETINDIKKFEKHLRLEIEYRNDDDPVAGFNWFYKTAPAEYLFCMHDDIILHPDFLRKMCAVMDEGKDAYCAMQFIRYNRTAEVYSGKPVVYLPTDPPESLHGQMELFQMGLRASVMEKYAHPLFRPHDFMAGRGQSCDINQETMDKLQPLVSLYPVLDANGNTDVLLTHFTTEFALWNDYDHGKEVK